MAFICVEHLVLILPEVVVECILHVPDIVQRIMNQKLEIKGAAYFDLQILEVGILVERESWMLLQLVDLTICVLWLQ